MVAHAFIEELSLKLVDLIGRLAMDRDRVAPAANCCPTCGLYFWPLVGTEVCSTTAKQEVESAIPTTPEVHPPPAPEKAAQDEDPWLQNDPWTAAANDKPELPANTGPKEPVQPNRNEGANAWAKYAPTTSKWGQNCWTAKEWQEPEKCAWSEGRGWQCFPRQTEASTTQAAKSKPRKDVKTGWQRFPWETDMPTTQLPEGGEWNKVSRGSSPWQLAQKTQALAAEIWEQQQKQKDQSAPDILEPVAPELQEETKLAAPDSDEVAAAPLPAPKPKRNNAAKRARKRERRENAAQKEASEMQELDAAKELARQEKATLEAPKANAPQSLNSLRLQIQEAEKEAREAEEEVRETGLQYQIALENALAYNAECADSDYESIPANADPQCVGTVGFDDEPS